MNANKKIVIDLITFIIIISLIFIFLILKDKNYTQQVSRMETVGYSNYVGIGDSYLETSIVTTSPFVAETTPVETTEPLNETIIDHSNIQRASLPSDYSSEVVNLKNSNVDTRGWVGISNTNISYAFTQTEDNAFYLDHDFYGNESGAGWIFMDYRGTFDENGQQSDVITLYGHNMANGSMFSTLKRYRDNPDFYETNPIITLSSSNGYKYYKIFAYMVCYGREGSDFEFWKYSDLSDPNTFYDYVNKAFNKSLIITGVDVQYGDKIVALSTCNTGSSSNHDRFVVLARMVRDGEDVYEGCYRIR